MTHNEERLITDIRDLIQENKQLKRQIMLQRQEIQSLKFLLDIEEDCGEYVVKKRDFR